MNKRTVLLHGQSLLMPPVTARPEKSPGLCVARATTWQETSSVQAERTPDVLIPDLADTCQRRVLPLLFNRSHLMLVGLDTERNQAGLLSGQEARSLTLEGLRDIILRREER